MVKLKLIIINLFLILISLSSISALPDYFDWRDNNGNWMADVKDQGDYCGSCWAFAAVGITEAQYNIEMDDTNYDLNLSEEYLVSDCFQGSPYSDCRGGWNYQALGDIKNNGVVNESCFSYNDYDCSYSGSVCSTITCTYNTSNVCSDYTCSDNQCTDSNAFYYINDYQYIQNNKTKIKDWLYNVGPVAASMKWGGGHWDNGIRKCNVDLSVDHAIIITGYNETGDYWIVKNSAGPSWWIDGGYFNLGFGECGIETLVYGVNLTLCECTSWTTGSCGTYGCGPYEKPWNRTCTPSGCDVESDCVFDNDCASGGDDITVCASGCDYDTIMEAVENSGSTDRIYITDSRTYDEQVYMDDVNTAGWLKCTNGGNYR